MNIIDKISLKRYKGKLGKAIFSKKSINKLSMYLEKAESEFSMEEKVIIIQHLSKNKIIEYINNDEIKLDSKSRKIILNRLKNIEKLEQVRLTEIERNTVINNMNLEEMTSYLEKLDRKDQVEVLKSAGNNNVSIEILENGLFELSEDERKNIIDTINPELKEKYIKENSNEIYFCIELMKSLTDNIKIDLIKNTELDNMSNTQKTEIIGTMETLKQIQALRSIELKPEFRGEILKKLPEETILKYILEEKDFSAALNVLQCISDESKLKIFRENCSKIVKDKVIMSLSPKYEDKKVEYILGNPPIELKKENIEKIQQKQIKVIASLSSKYNQYRMDSLDALIQYKDKCPQYLKHNLNQNIAELALGILKHGKDSSGIDKVKQVLDVTEMSEAFHRILKEVEPVSEGDVESNVNKESVRQMIDILYPAESKIRYEMYKEIEEKYKDAYKSIDIEFLTEENKKLFGEKVFDISKYYELQKNICSLETSEKKVLTQLYPLIENNNKWKKYLVSFLTSLQNEKYTKLFFKLSEDGKIKYDHNKILKILISDPQNMFGIEEVEDIENFEQIRKNIIDKLIKRRRRGRTSRIF